MPFPFLAAAIIGSGIISGLGRRREARSAERERGEFMRYQEQQAAERERRRGEIAGRIRRRRGALTRRYRAPRRPVTEQMGLPAFTPRRFTPEQTQYPYMRRS